MKIDDLLKQSICAEAEVPDGFYTRQQFQELSGLQSAQAGRVLSDAVREGRLERRLYKVPSGNRPAMPTPHYGPIKL